MPRLAYLSQQAKIHHLRDRSNDVCCLVFGRIVEYEDFEGVLIGFC